MHGHPTQRRAVATLLSLSLALVFFPAGLRAQGRALRVAAAADLRKPFAELIPLFKKETGAEVTPIFGSTGLLAKQAEQGAPFDLLFAADESYVQRLEKKGRIVPGTRTLYAVGRLVFWTRQGRPHPGTLADLAQPAYRRVAIANPRHAPYGVAAKEALQKAGIWVKVEPRIVYGENIQQTLLYAQTGNADVAVAALSLAVGSSGTYTLIPDRLHAPIRQAVGILARSRKPALARRFIGFVLGPKGQGVLRRYGFTLPRRAR